ncbi:hypothetical protein LINPERPRIM_LOCUS28099 [Linum perenne]
MLLLWSSLKN